MVFFLLDDFKTTFQIRHLTHRWEQSGYFFLKPGNLFFLECLIMQFFSSLTSDLRDTTPHQRSFTLLSRVMEDFPGGGNHSKHMPPLTYLAWLQPIYYNSSFAFIHISITKVLLLVKTLMKKYYFFQVQFWKYCFFQVQFLKILFFFRFSFWKYYFFSGSVFENKIVKQISNHTNQSATMKT